MPDLSIRLNNFITEIVDLYVEEKTIWLDKLSESGEVYLNERKETCMFIESIGGVAPYIDDRYWDSFDLLLNKEIINNIVGSTDNIASISVKLKQTDGTALININYKEHDNDNEIEEKIMHTNLMILKLLAPFSSDKLRGNYFSGVYCFEVEIGSENELAMKFIELNW